MKRGGTRQDQGRRGQGGQEYLTVEEIARRFGRSVRTVRRDIANGLQTYEGALTGFHGKGSAQRLIRPEEYRAWLAEQKGGARPQPMPAGAGVGAVPPAEMAPADLAEIERQLQDPAAGADDLAAMRARLERAERAAHREYLMALKGRAAGAADWLGVWQGLCEARRKVEKDLPEIMHRRGRFVDALEVGKLLTNAVTGMAAELDQVGISVAEACVGKTAREIRLLVDDRIRSARQHVTRLWETMISAGAGRAEKQQSEPVCLERTDGVRTNGDEDTEAEG